MVEAGPRQLAGRARVVVADMRALPPSGASDSSPASTICVQHLLDEGELETAMDQHRLAARPRRAARVRHQTLNTIPLIFSHGARLEEDGAFLLLAGRGRPGLRDGLTSVGTVEARLDRRQFLARASKPPRAGQYPQPTVLGARIARRASEGVDPIHGQCRECA